MNTELEQPADESEGWPSSVIYVVLLSSASIVWVFLVAFFFFAQPISDDFNRAVEVSRRGVIESIQSEYYGWSGRWLGGGLSYVVASIGDITRWYWLMLLVTGSVCFLGLYCAFRMILPNAIPSREVFCLAYVGVALYWSTMPAPGETFYWLTGAFENHLSIVVMLCVLGRIAVLTRRNEKQQDFSFYSEICALSICSFVIPGFHELFGCVWICLLCYGFCWCLATGAAATIRSAWAVCLMFGVGGLILVMAAPGNDVRIASQEYHPNLQTALLLAFKQLFVSLRGWIGNPAVIATSFLLLLKPERVEKGSGANVRLLWFWRYGFPLCGIIVVAGCMFGGAVARGKPLADRPLNAVYALFLIFWFGTLFLWKVTSVSTRYSRFPPYAFAVCLFSFALVFTGRLSAGAVSDLRDRAGLYRQDALGRYQVARDAVRRDDLKLVVAAYSHRPKVFKSVDLGVNADDGPNQAFARYFGLDSVVVRSE